ncbi:MAG: hypothetical protein SFH39_02760 [Candidatus Magnetobacterium sp. LHC-1]|uniref:Uncharacterized protein n=1 Tax=Candidatus Magnetobacterium casense TaxID=1455061 RepID=A0ABS6S1W1_9BACT|nr:hypothetical protein [Candidatus Magnetobacterium casensis]MBF0608588.1 hypothetical protein [Nitrospirota bacterium]MBV6342829.1 hypothetical protein [Candidatus Magnetobacterium casensis]
MRANEVAQRVTDEVVLLKDSKPFDSLNEDEQIDALICALRQYGKISVPMCAQFEKAVEDVHQEAAQVTMPFYVK